MRIQTVFLHKDEMEQRKKNRSNVKKNLLLKKEINIYVGLFEMQRKWYQSLLEKDIDAFNEIWPTLHDRRAPRQRLGKIVILNKTLSSMKEKGLRILIFSQMSHILDILEDYGLFGQYNNTAISTAGPHMIIVSARLMNTTNLAMRSSSSCSQLALEAWASI